MNENTHSATLISPDGKTVAFIDGIPDKCKHQWDGGTYFVTSSGEIILPGTYKKWASYTSQMRDPLIHRHQENIDDPVVGGGSTCSKCHRIFEPDLR